MFENSKTYCNNSVNVSFVVDNNMRNILDEVAKEYLSKGLLKFWNIICHRKIKYFE